MRAVARNVHIGFVATGIPSKSFGKGLDRIDVVVLHSALLFLGWGVKFVNLLGIPAPAMNREI